VDVGAGIFVLTRHADVQRVLRDSVFSADRRRADAVQRNRAQLSEEFLGEGGLFRSMLTMDPPDHTRVRGLVSKAFTPRRVAGLRPRIEAITRELLDAGVLDGRLDEMADLAAPLPAIVIAELLGVPPRTGCVSGSGLRDGRRGEQRAHLRSRSRTPEAGARPLQAYLRDVIAGAGGLRART
jgi:cytochrome P450